MIRGLRSPDPRALELMRSYAALARSVLWKLRLPASLPYLFTALKIAATASIVGAIVGEGPGRDPRRPGARDHQVQPAVHHRAREAVGRDHRLRRAGHRLLRRSCAWPSCSSCAGRQRSPDAPEQAPAAGRPPRGRREDASERQGDDDRALERHRPGDRPRRVRVPHRSIRLRQEHAAAAHRRPDRPDRWHRGGQRQAGRAARGSTASTGWSSRRPSCSTGAPSRRTSELPLELHGQDRAERARARAARCSSSSSSATSRATTLPAVGRHAAARGHRPRAGLSAADPADGRAIRRARRDDARADELRGAAHLGADRHHRHVRHALDPRGGLPLHPRGGDERPARSHHADSSRCDLPRPRNEETREEPAILRARDRSARSAAWQAEGWAASQRSPRRSGWRPREASGDDSGLLRRRPLPPRPRQARRLGRPCATRAGRHRPCSASWRSSSRSRWPGCDPAPRPSAIATALVDNWDAGR